MCWQAGGSEGGLVFVQRIPFGDVLNTSNHFEANIL
jgi:hypothetical protein